MTQPLEDSRNNIRACSLIHLYVIISCGVNNRFGLPDAQVLADIEAAGAELYRTDTDGTIICTTDGTDISFRTAGKTETSSGEAS